MTNAAIGPTGHTLASTRSAKIGSTIRTTHLPASDGEAGAYLTLLTDSLERAGVRFVSAPGLTDEWVRSAGRHVDVAHLHWLEFIAPSEPGPLLGAAKTLRRAARFERALDRLKAQGVSVVWTIHNLAPHEPMHPRIEQRLARSVAARADAAIVHSMHARSHAATRFGHPDKLAVIPHGNYVGAYPEPRASTAELRRERGIPDDAYVYLAFGQVRRYKRLPDLATAFRTLPGDELRLLIVGAPVDAAEAKHLRSLAASDERIVLDLRRIPVAEVSEIHAVADAAVFAYDDMFSSGSALLALSCGLPIVVPANSTGTEIADAAAVVAVESDRLATALDAVRRGDQPTRRAAARTTAARYDWDGVARQTARLYESLRERRHSG